MLDFFRQSAFAKFRSRYSLTFMNLAQFGAIVNDNIYKLTMVFLLIDTLGKAQASTILSKAGAIFVIPFLLFSSAAGVLADRFSKKWILTVMKIWEVTVFLAAIPIFLTRSSFGCYLLLFFLGTHSAIFGPSKYGIIPELVEKEVIPKANSIITSTTYLGIIIGTFLGSLLTDITGHAYTIVMVICFVFAGLGFLCSLIIQKTPKQGSTRKVSLFFVREVYQTLLVCKEYKHLRMVLVSSAYFLFVAAYTQLAVIPYTIQSLGLNEVNGGYLFLCTALGIAVGAILAGKILKKKVDLAVPAFSIFVISILFIALFLVSGSVIGAIIVLSLLGIAGGLFVVPMDAFVQLSCPNERRGQVIGAGNFLGFIGVLLASACLYLFSNLFGLSAAQGFAVMGILTFLFAANFAFRHSDILVQALCRRFAKGELTFQNENLFTRQKNPPLLILQHATWKKFFYLSRYAPDYHFLLSEKTRPLFRFLAKTCYHLHIAPATPEALLAKAKELQTSGIPVCVILQNQVRLEENLEEKSWWHKILTPWTQPHLFVDIHLPLAKGKPTTIIFSPD
jgi:acyl-[acyl-carrier-protein]-phospholipid O-acyltransferase/long-chain-fatty-acid--[acyl-carrier-protein] ligase